MCVGEQESKRVLSSGKEKVGESCGNALCSVCDESDEQTLKTEMNTFFALLSKSLECGIVRSKM